MVHKIHFSLSDIAIKQQCPLNDNVLSIIKILPAFSVRPYKGNR